MRPSRSTILGSVLLAAAVGGAAWFAARPKPGPVRLPAPETPHRNARPGVAFVGDDVCAKCHADVARTYREHPMGRSIAPIAEADDFIKGKEGAPAELFESRGFHYALARRDGKTFHSESRRDSQGREIGRIEGEVRHVLGSGSHALAFLVEKDGYLFQSPVTWYSQTKRWDLAPGFENREARLERQITPGCLVCHANRFEHVEGTEGRYEPPIFHGRSIGCERCHGPGGLHAGNPAADALGPNIVNPIKLDDDARDDVCRQCHLLGEATVARYGRDVRDFRPGLALSDFVTTFVRAGGGSDDHPNADHVEALELSRCRPRNGGTLACVACHDPHAVPKPEVKVSHYRDKCLNCHRDKGCSLPNKARLETETREGCVACHMPRAATSDVPHVSTTLHRIVRSREQGLAILNAARSTPEAEPDLVPYGRDRMSAERLEAADRDLGVALRHRRSAAPKILPLLESAVKKRPDDRLARESLGFARWALGRDAEALSTFEAVLKEEPRRESSLEAAALVASKLRLHDRAVEFWRRASDVDPWRSSFHAGRAFDLTRLRLWSEAEAAAEAALRLDPANREARFASILAARRTGDEAEARRRFETLLEFRPAERDELVRWFLSVAPQPASSTPNR